MTYLPRVVDDELDELSGSLPALAIEGARGVGKTVTASRRAARVLALDEPPVRELLAADPTVVEATTGTIVLDEWQRLPLLWDYVRRAVDAGAPPGRYLLTGSAVPVESPSHSGAGRIVPVRMRPLSLAERGLIAPTVSLADLLSGTRPEVGGRSDVRLADYVEEILASGFPAIRRLAGRARRAQLDGYLARLVERDFPEQGLRVRRPDGVRAWLTAYAAATSTPTSYNRLAEAAGGGLGQTPAKTTTIAYRDVLSQLWLLDPVPGWAPTRNHLSRLTVAPKHQLADPALACRLLGVTADGLLTGRSGVAAPRDGALLGNLFEALVTLGIKVYAQANEGSVFHLRTQDNRHEVDLVVQRGDQRVVALEVKLGAAPDADDVQHLRWLRERLGDDLLDAAVITTGEQAYRRADGIAVIPAALLGP